MVWGPLNDSTTNLATIGRLSGFNVLNMFDRESQLTITESVIESADPSTDPALDPVKIGLWL